MKTTNHFKIILSDAVVLPVFENLTASYRGAFSNIFDIHTIVVIYLINNFKREIYDNKFYLNLM
jgi:hypothetical protein